MVDYHHDCDPERGRLKPRHAICENLEKARSGICLSRHIIADIQHSARRMDASQSFGRHVYGSDMLARTDRSGANAC